MLSFEEKIYVKKISSLGKFLLAGDIGGTKSKFAVVNIQNKIPKLILSVKIASKSIKSFGTSINQILKYVKEKYGIKIVQSNLACAGKVSTEGDYCKLTNLEVAVDAKEILKKTELKKVVLLNDMQAAAYGLQVVDKKSCVQINKTKSKEKNGNKVVFGAGTGLGKSILIWDKNCKKYICVPSEGGHADFAVRSKEELDLVEFVKKNRKKSPSSPASNVEWEELVSGVGIQNIYKFLQKDKKFKKTKISQEIEKNKFSPVLISKYKDKDLRCKKTFELFTVFYAKAAKNFALEALALGGVYFVANIAAKNLDIFKSKAFLSEFENSFKFKSSLKQIPVFVVTDTNIGLYGAAIQT